MATINISRFFHNAEPCEFSASAAELGQDAGKITWNNAKREAAEAPLLTTPEQLDALRAWAKATGAWDEDERNAWDDDECNALFIQLVSGDMREAGFDDYEPSEEAWEEYYARAERGEISGNMYRGDDGEIYYILEG